MTQKRKTCETCHYGANEAMYRRQPKECNKCYMCNGWQKKKSPYKGNVTKARKKAMLGVKW